MGLSEKFPSIAAEWDYSAPENQNVSPEVVKAGSGIKRAWVCLKCGHRWTATPHPRTGHNKTGCPGKCKKEKFSKTRLNTRKEQGRQLVLISPEIAKEWDYSSSLNQNKKLEDILAGDPKKYGWTCSLSHRWAASVGVRVKQNTKCPICSNHTLLSGFNDFQTLYPEQAKQIHPTKNKYDLTKILGAPRKRTWWKCEKGHEWETTFDVKVRRPGCSGCIPNNTSKIEKRFRDSFSHWFETINEDHTFVLVTSKNKKVKPDIYGMYRNMPIVVEYDGEWWHKEGTQRDSTKTKLLLADNLIVVRIRENSLHYLPIQHPNLYQFRFQYEKDAVEELVQEIILTLNERIQK